MALELTGKLTRILNPQTGAGKNGNWQKQEFILETFDQYPKKICVSVWGDKVDDLKKFSLGDNIKASINIESREYNERWYTDVRAWRLEPDGGATSANQSRPAAPAASDDFGFEPYKPSPASASDAAVDDDLPF